MSSTENEHYFSETPQSKESRKQITLKLLDGERIKIESAAGIFSADDIDEGTATLMRKAPRPEPSSHVLDLGCGYGPLTLAYGMADPTLEITAIDVNERALELTRINAETHGVKNVTVSTPDKVDPAISFDYIYSNPPIRIGKKELHGILNGWLKRLTPTGSAFLVVHKHLGSDSLQKWLIEEGWTCERLSSAHGFRVLQVQRGDEQQ